MVLSNRERQARYRERLKAAAEAAKMSDAQAELLREFRRRVVECRERVDALRAGRFRLFEQLPDGTRADLTLKAIADEERALDEYDRLLRLYDPDDLTV